jgi:thymidylate synthase
MNSIDKAYTNLLQDILDNGVEKKDRTGTGTISVFGRQIRHKMSDRFPLLTTKKMPFRLIATELMWFLRGDTNIKYLVDNDCHIWDGDCFANYLKTRDRFSNKDNVKEDVVINGMNGSSNRAYTQEEFINKIKTDDEFAKKWGDLGPVYGKQWRQWGDGGYSTWTDIHDEVRHKHRTEYPQIDQIQNLINDLKTNPDSRRLMVNAWNVGELDQMVLPPCHYGFQVYTRELSEKERMNTLVQNEQRLIYEEVQSFKNVRNKKIKDCLDKRNVPTRAISLMWNQRSVDTFLGLPFNIASYGLLLEIIAKAVNMVPDELIGNLGDTHLYSNHVEQAKEQIGRKYTAEERTEMLKEAMGYEAYHKAVDELMPFGGGLSEYYDFHKIPHHTREPYPLPTLKINSGNENWHLLTIDEIINSLDIDITFKVDGYQSHPTIKAPLSN